jgi:hypothetical protein
MMKWYGHCPLMNFGGKEQIVQRLFEDQLGAAPDDVIYGAWHELNRHKDAFIKGLIEDILGIARSHQSGPSPTQYPFGPDPRNDIAYAVGRLDKYFLLRTDRETAARLILDTIQRKNSRTIRWHQAFRRT